jgi:tetratricopeptide (TPR) repeat protein
MHIHLHCECGKQFSVTEAAAGASLTCDCGRTIKVPSLNTLRQQSGAEAAQDATDEAIVTLPPPLAEPPPPEQPPPSPDPFREIIAPTPVSLRTEYRTLQGRPRPVMACLTADALWLQDTWELRQVPLPSVTSVETFGYGKELLLTLGPDASAERLRLTFASVREGRRWFENLEECRAKLLPHTTPAERPIPEGVALVRRPPEVPHVVLGRVAFTGRTPRTADQGVQLRAGLRGADAVVALERRRCPDLGWGARHVSGVAIRVEDAAARQQLRQRWHAEEVDNLVARMLLLLAIQAGLLFVFLMFCAGLPGFTAPAVETPQEALASAGVGLGLLYAWPLVLLALARHLRWPPLLRAAGLGVLVATTGRGLAVALAHVLALLTAAAPAADSRIWLLADPVDWAIMLGGVVLFVRAWRLAGDTLHMLPQPATVPAARTAWARSQMGLTAVYAVGLLGFAGYSRYQVSAGLLQPKVDARSDEEAVRTFNQGVAHLREDDLAAAEGCFEQSLGLWEELTARGPVTLSYRANMTRALYNLGWICHKQGRLEEAEAYYARAVETGESAAAVPPRDAEFKQCLSDARDVLADLRSNKAVEQLSEKDRAGVRKYEEAQVKAAKGDVGAEGLYREAIAVWEEILPHDSGPEYRRFAVTRLATAYLMLAEQQQQQGRRAEIEAALLKSIDYGEQAVVLAPDRPLARHNLDVARQMLDRQREQAHLDEMNKLWAAERYADALDVCAKGIADQEEHVRMDKDREAAVRRLAYRLDRSAWMLAHCPDARVRDTKAAVKHARRATELQADIADYWYTLAMVQYRNGDWRDSLGSLEQLKAREGAFDGSSWLLVAMNRQQLKKRDEARAALRQAIAWIEEQKRKAEDDALVRFRFELARPAIEALRREAEALIEGKDPAAVGVG